MHQQLRKQRKQKQKKPICAMSVRQPALVVNFPFIQIPFNGVRSNTVKTEKQKLVLHSLN